MTLGMLSSRVSERASLLMHWIGLGLGPSPLPSSKAMATTGDFHIVVAVADAGAGGCAVVPGSWWQLSLPSDNAWVVVDVIDAEGCPGFVSGGVSVMVVCTYLMVLMTLACHGVSLLVLLNAKC